ncbi:primosomal protein N' [Kerstersia gyiorum]|uniref:primosomal protein N' n=1 Tax=Kerstersia gyiorum TaxID=206506 RepID=UPI00209EFE07|nr:primosomal protein N' [Kerstersia gyiorum]MCP1672499.1 primosomal protein N' (replication factor Y) [Kerstersia gyiorum]MCP1710497.1 primosomal protein N' (replication factor Y) [Kerstersia gyiorum]
MGDSPDGSVATAVERPCWVRIVLDVPLPGPFDYRHDQPLAPGLRVIVPFGKRQLVGLVVDNPAEPAYEPAQVRAIEQVLDDLPPLTEEWFALARFAADYYQRPLGEVALPALPGPLRRPAAYQGSRAAGGPVARLARRRKRASKKAPEVAAAVVAAAVAESVVESAAEPGTSDQALPGAQAPVLNDAQRHAVETMTAQQAFKAFLLHGVTGSGKTEVYLHAAAEVLRAGRQVLMLVPEINLTPQFEHALRARLAPLVGADAVAVMHSGLADGERLDAWVKAVNGTARVMLGTRMAIFAPMQQLGLIVVDEEHDTSYKQQDGLRYSARDLAVWRAHALDIPVVLGSATPALETWLHAQRGSYQRLSLPARARASALPAIRLVDTRRLVMEEGLSPHLLSAIEERLARSEQSLVFLNRRGYAPVLHCDACGWVSQCPRCSVHTVLHRRVRAGHYLQCHHCGFQAPVPRACPECGDQDLRPMGRGTQRVEETLAERFPEARILRIDADSTRLKGSAERMFDSVRAGEVDILVGTQMVAKGHDFPRLTLVGVLNADAMLYSQDFRAPERLFAQLMQVSGRAGRHERPGEVLIQTGYPDQEIYQAVLRHDYEGFARYALEEREAAGLPPYLHQALLATEARELAQALDFLTQARELADTVIAECGMAPGSVMLYDPVPLRVVKVAHMERAQLLLESAHRPSLQFFLRQWVPRLQGLGRLRWQLEVDPLDI